MFDSCTHIERSKILAIGVKCIVIEFNELFCPRAQLTLKEVLLRFETLAGTSDLRAICWKSIELLV